MIYFVILRILAELINFLEYVDGRTRTFAKIYSKPSRCVLHATIKQGASFTELISRGGVVKNFAHRCKTILSRRNSVTGARYITRMRSRWRAHERLSHVRVRGRIEHFVFDSPAVRRVGKLGPYRDPVCRREIVSGTSKRIRDRYSMAPFVEGLARGFLRGRREGTRVRSLALCLLLARSLTKERQTRRRYKDGKRTGDPYTVQSKHNRYARGAMK